MEYRLKHKQTVKTKKKKKAVESKKKYRNKIKQKNQHQTFFRVHYCPVFFFVLYRFLFICNAFFFNLVLYYPYPVDKKHLPTYCL